MYRSGDRGRLLPDGRLEHLGRLDDQVKLRGYRIEPAEIKAALLADPEVTAAAVIFRRGQDPDSARLDAYVVAADCAGTGGSGGLDASSQAIRRRVARVLPDYMVPASVTVVAALPLTVNGKLDIERLQASAGVEPASRISSPPASPSPGTAAPDAQPSSGGAVEESVLAAWSSVLQTSVGLDDNFFDLGGNSLIAIRLLSVMAEFGLAELSPREPLRQSHRPRPRGSAAPAPLGPASAISMTGDDRAWTTTSPRSFGRLHRKIAIVTGAARGIGRACAVALAAAGADVALIDIAADIAGCTYPLGTAAQLTTTSQLCQEHGVAVVTCHADLRSASGLASAVETIVDRLGGADILVNNAGLATPAGLPAHELTEDQWQLMMDVDLTGAWRMMRLVVPQMLDRRSGSVINIASTAGVVGYPHFANYTAAKHGLVGLTRAAALDYAASGVRVNALCPGSVRDEPELEGRMLGGIADALQLPADRHEQVFIESQPTRRLVSAYDVANACRWLASDDSRGVTGSVITVDGGYTAR